VTPDRRNRYAAIIAVILSSIATAVALVAIMVARSATYRAPAAPEQPKVTDWMQAWGTIAGAVTGLLAALAASALLWHEMRQARVAREQLAAEREEAALNVPRAVVVSSASFGTYGRDDEDKRGNQVVARVVNYGSGPIRNLAVIVTVPETGLQLILPGRDLLGPNEEASFNQSYTAGWALPRSWVPGLGKAPVTACFIDHTNQAWERSSDGSVTRTTVPYPRIEEALASTDSITEWR